MDSDDPDGPRRTPTDPDRSRQMHLYLYLFPSEGSVAILAQGYLWSGQSCVNPRVAAILVLHPRLFNGW